MTPLRQRFIEDMQLRGLPNLPNTSPDRLDLEAVRQYELYLLHEKKFSPETINSFVSAVQFLYLVTLEMPWGKECFPRVRRFFVYVGCLKNRAALMLCYGAGLRISEAVAVKVSDMDSQRMLIRIEQGKGRKHRYAMLSPRLLAGGSKTFCVNNVLL